MTTSLLPKLWQNGLRTTKSRYWSGHHKALISIPQNICEQNWKSVCEQGGLQTWLSYTSSISRNGPKFTQLIVGSLWKATWNVWPKLNNFKATLPNTNWVYVNFWPTGNVMKEIKAEINHSLYYYSDNSQVVILTDLRQGIFMRIKCPKLWKTEFKCIWQRCM